MNLPSRMRDTGSHENDPRAPRGGTRPTVSRAPGSRPGDLARRFGHFRGNRIHPRIVGFCGLALLFCHDIAQAQTLPPSPVLFGPSMREGQFHFTVETPPDWAVGIERSPDLTAWGEFASNQGRESPLEVADASSPTVGQQYYRAFLHAPNTAVATNYQGWTNAILLGNGLVEVVIVPSAGRVLQFRFVGETNGPFFENPKLYGKSASSSSWNTTGGFGGDKAWPSPQSDWNWPPPLGFDGSPFTAVITNGVVWLTGPVDNTYKIRVTRRIELAFTAPEMRITTDFERVAATSRTNRVLGVWVITQTADPVNCYLPVPDASIFPKGYTILGGTVPKGFAVTNGLLTMPRDRSSANKIGSDAGTLLWVGTNWCLRVDSPREPGLPKTAYPDSGSSAEIYTNPNPVAYVELEMLGPLDKLQVGETKSRSSTWRLYHRQEADPESEARRILGLAAPAP
jgi:hypothetical protein